MPIEPGLAEPEIDIRDLPQYDDEDVDAGDGPYVVILYNDDYHGFEEVVSQIQKATGHPLEKCVGIMLEAHTRGRAIAFTGSQEACDRAAGVLRQIRLQVETDKF